MLPLQHLPGKPVGNVVIVVEDGVEPGLHLAAREPAEVIRELERLFLPVLEKHLSAHAGSAHGKEFSADLDEAKERHLLAFELGAVADHGVEQHARELASGTLHEAEVLRKRAEFPEAGEVARAEPESRVPAGIKQTCLQERPQFRAPAGLRIHQIARQLQVEIDRLAGEEEAHDFARALENEVDAEVTHHPLHRDRLLATRGERGGRLVTSSAADLHCLVYDPPAGLRVVHFRHRGFQADIVSSPVHHRGT